MNKYVQSLWIGQDLTIIEQQCIQSYIDNGMDFHLYIYDKNIKHIPDTTIIKNANEILSESEIFEYSDGGVSAFSNVFRYKLLYDKGGIWVDMDMICLRHFKFKEDYVFSSEMNRYNKQHVNVGFIKVPEKSKLMLLCYKNSLVVKKLKPKWGELGPKLFKKFVEKLRLTKYIKPYTHFCPISYYEIDNILNLKKNKHLLKHSYCVHLWNGYFYRNNIDKNSLNIL